MARTLGEARHEVQDLLRDHAGLRVDPAVVRGWLDQGQKDVAALTYAYQRAASFTESPPFFVAGQRLYAHSAPVGAGGMGLPDVLAILHLRLDGTPLPKWTAQMVGIADQGTQGEGTPRYWYDYAGELSFLPYPSPSFTGAPYALDAIYAARPATWTHDDEVSVLPESFDVCLILFAAARVLMSKRLWTQAGRLWQDYITMLSGGRTRHLLHYGTPKTAWQQPVQVERTDEPRRRVLIEEARRRLRTPTRTQRRA